MWSDSIENWIRAEIKKINQSNSQLIWIFFFLHRFFVLLQHQHTYSPHVNTKLAETIQQQQPQFCVIQFQWNEIGNFVKETVTFRMRERNESRTAFWTKKVFESWKFLLVINFRIVQAELCECHMKREREGERVIRDWKKKKKKTETTNEK